MNENDIYDGAFKANDDVLAHIGVKRKSGRYKWGSGEVPYQHEEWFLQNVRDLKKAGVSEKDIATQLGFKSIDSLRARISASTLVIRKADISKALELKDQGMNNSEIARQMGTNESTVRGWLKQGDIVKNSVTDQTLDILRKNVAEKKYIDIGEGAEYQITDMARNMNISQDKLKKCVKYLQDEEGYSVTTISVEQMGTGKYTNVRVLAAPGVERSEISKNREQIAQIVDRYNDRTGTFDTEKMKHPMVSINSDRVAINYAETGGITKDGVIFIRPGVPDLTLGDSRYAQVRILVDDNKYLKGMAVYSNDIPDGYDIMFNTNKHEGTPKEKVLKSIKDETEMSKVMATIKPGGQPDYMGEDGKPHHSAINLVREEGDWDTWSKTLASQMLSKQPEKLIKKQLKLTYDEKYEEFDEIMKLTNPEVKKKLLEEFANQCDSDAVHMKAAAMPRQSTKVILPVDSLKDNEIYAPTYNDGETLVLIRYPHGGKFEIPTVVVNNKNKEAKAMLGNTSDAVGINSKVAERLSGADFDGDTVVCIPNNNGDVKTQAPLEGLKGFDPKESYPKVEGMKQMTSSKQRNAEMGKISNLITDMTILGATTDELARADRHSMVVIDALKHELNYKQSEIDNNIAELRLKYQGKASGGAATLISRAKGQANVPERKDYFDIDPETGAVIYKETGRTYIDKNGKEIKATTKSTKMAETSDARTLISDAGSAVENLYASYANGMKALANMARKETLAVQPTKVNPEAKEKYATEIASLNAQLAVAKSNAPYERQAQILANTIAKTRIKANPDLDDEAKKKIKGRSLEEAREKVGAKKQSIEITPNEWAAIQNGAISSTKITEILNNTNTDVIRKYATPRTESNKVSSAKINMAKSMDNSGFTIKEIADRLDVSTSTVVNILNGSTK